MKKYALIVAGGSGTRMKTLIPKQFLMLAGKPIVLHTLEAFWKYNAEIEIILVLPITEFSTWQAIVEKYNLQKKVSIVAGGKSRFESVKNGLQLIENGGIVAVHDAVRPLVSTETIATSFEVAQKKGSAIASISLKDSLRMLNATNATFSEAVNREQYKIVQTPQTFQTKLIKAAFANAEKLSSQQNFTDDASVAEANGNEIYLIEGSYENIKITTPEDILFAEAFLKK
jgi:2-C-methyl-D-erythritol 4-phosphate cytidylyltransferase